MCKAWVEHVENAAVAGRLGGSRELIRQYGMRKLGWILININKLMWPEKNINNNSFFLIINKGCRFWKDSRELIRQYWMMKLVCTFGIFFIFYLGKHALEHIIKF